MNNIAYVVTGERGSYSGFRMWLVAGFPTKERADAYRDFLDGFRRGLSASARASFPSWGEISFEEEEKLLGQIEARAGEIGLSARTAFGIEEAYDSCVILDPDGYGHEIKYKVAELPWDTKIAGGIPA